MNGKFNWDETNIKITTLQDVIFLALKAITLDDQFDKCMNNRAIFELCKKLIMLILHKVKEIKANKDDKHLLKEILRAIDIYNNKIAPKTKKEKVYYYLVDKKVIIKKLQQDIYKSDKEIKNKIEREICDQFAEFIEYYVWHVELIKEINAAKDNFQLNKIILTANIKEHIVKNRVGICNDTYSYNFIATPTSVITSIKDVTDDAKA